MNDHFVDEHIEMLWNMFSCRISSIQRDKKNYRNVLQAFNIVKVKWELPKKFLKTVTQ